MRERDYETVYAELADARAYNMKLLDGAMVQMMYEFRDGALLRHRLAFFPSLRLAPFQEMPRWFIDFILRNFYHTAFHQYAEKLPTHGALFETTISPKEQKTIHISGPG